MQYWSKKTRRRKKKKKSSNRRTVYIFDPSSIEPRERRGRCVAGRSHWLPERTLIDLIVTLSVRQVSMEVAAPSLLLLLYSIRRRQQRRQQRRRERLFFYDGMASIGLSDDRSLFLPLCSPFSRATQNGKKEEKKRRWWRLRRRRWLTYQPHCLLIGEEQRVMSLPSTRKAKGREAAAAATQNLIYSFAKWNPGRTTTKRSDADARECCCCASLSIVACYGIITDTQTQTLLLFPSYQYPLEPTAVRTHV